jgi:hypothetical protein
MEKNTKASDVALLPLGKLSASFKRILSTSKKQSDVQLAEFQDANRKKREAKKKR